MPRRSIAVAIIAGCQLLGSRALGGNTSAGAAGPTWAWATISRQNHPGRNVLPENHQVASVLGAMIDGDAVVMFLDPWRAFDSVPVEDLMARRITFAAQDADLGRIAAILKTCCRRRLRFRPRAREEHLTLLLDQVALGDLLMSLSAYGRIELTSGTGRPVPFPP